MPDPLLPRVLPEGLEPRAVPEAPSTGDLQWLLTLSAQGRHGDLLQAVDAAIARFPGHAALWGLKASAHFALKDHRSAVDACLQALAITPDAPEHHSNIGYALAELGDFDAAIAACRRALASRPDFPAALGNMALAQVRSGRFFEAAASARQAVALKPDDSVCWATLGTALMNIEAFDDALAAYDRSIGLDPACAQAQTNRALLLLLLGRWTEGLPAYEWREQELPVPPPWCAACHGPSRGAWQVGMWCWCTSRVWATPCSSCAMRPCWRSEVRVSSPPFRRVWRRCWSAMCPALRSAGPGTCLGPAITSSA